MQGQDKPQRVPCLVPCPPLSDPLRRHNTDGESTVTLFLSLRFNATSQRPVINIRNIPTLKSKRSEESFVPDNRKIIAHPSSQFDLRPVHKSSPPSKNSISNCPNNLRIFWLVNFRLHTRFYIETNQLYIEELLVTTSRRAGDSMPVIRFPGHVPESNRFDEVWRTADYKRRILHATFHPRRARRVSCSFLYVA